MSVRGSERFMVSIDTWGEAESYDDDVLWGFAPMLAELGAPGAATGVGGLSGGPTATFAILRPRGEDLGELTGRAIRLFEDACRKLDLEHRGIAKVEVLAASLHDLELTREPESYVGVTEIAGILGVSRQRVAQLREREDFPGPVAELAAGPVWTRMSLNRFVQGWPRKPGRPKRDEAHQASRAARSAR